MTKETHIKNNRAWFISRLITTLCENKDIPALNALDRTEYCGNLLQGEGKHKISEIIRLQKSSSREAVRGIEKI